MIKIFSSKRRILKAFMNGEVLTTLDANRIGKTTEGGRRIREIRQDYPIVKERIEGSNHYRYYLDRDYLAQSRKEGRFRKLCELFERVFK